MITALSSSTVELLIMTTNHLIFWRKDADSIMIKEQVLMGHCVSSLVHDLEFRAYIPINYFNDTYCCQFFFFNLVAMSRFSCSLFFSWEAQNKRVSRKVNKSAKMFWEGS